MRPWQDPRFRRAAWVTIGMIGWTGLIWIGAMLAALSPPRAGDDLRLLIDAARRLVIDEPLYSTVPAGGSLQAESLFYSYPPPVAQALEPVAGLPFELVLLLWGGGAVVGLAFVAKLLGRPAGGLVLPILALAPYTLPFAVALLFGNLNAWFPLAFGFVLYSVLSSGSRGLATGGVALGAMSVAKLHPASLVLWLAVRAARNRRWLAEPAVVAIAGLACLVIVTASLLLGGLEPWGAYATFLRSGAATSDLLSPLNIGPASQLALALGLDDASARSAQIAVTIGALVVTVASAWLVHDPVPSFGWATAASLVVLPVTWVHYPVALFPVAIASVARARTTPTRRTTIGLLVAAVVVAAIAIVVPVAMWIAVGLVLAAAHASRWAGRRDGPPAVTGLGVDRWP